MSHHGSEFNFHLTWNEPSRELRTSRLDGSFRCPPHPTPTMPDKLNQPHERNPCRWRPLATITCPYPMPGSGVSVRMMCLRPILKSHFRMAETDLPITDLPSDPSGIRCNGVRMFELEPSTLSNASRTFARTCGMSRSVKTIKVVMEDLHRVIIIPCPLACRDVLVQQCDSPSHLNRIVADIGGVRVSQTWTWNRFDDEIFTHDMEVFPMCLEICIIINP